MRGSSVDRLRGALVGWRLEGGGAVGSLRGGTRKERTLSRFRARAWQQRCVVVQCSYEDAEYRYILYRREGVERYN